MNNLKKLCYLLLPICTACTNNEEIFESFPKEIKKAELSDAKDIYKVTKEEAITNALYYIESGKTKSSESFFSKKVVSFEVVKNENFNLTKSIDLKIDTMFYIINFEGGGFAVTSTDKRTSPIYAYSDENSFHLSDTSKNEGLKIFIENSKVCLFRDIENYNKTYDTDSINSITINPPATKVGLIGIVKEVKPLTSVTWGQDAPFNTECFDGSKQAVAGCVAIATAQMLSFHKYPTSFENYSYNWTLINKIIDKTDQNKDQIGMKQLAHLIHRIGVNVDMKYGVSSSAAKSEKVPNLLKQMGFNNVSSVMQMNSNLIVSELDAGYPTYQRGYEDEHEWLLFHTYGGGHAWIIDGYQLRKVETRQCSYHGTELECDLVIHDDLYYHCNWGWDNDYNGYFRDFSYTTINAGTKFSFKYKLDMITVRR